MEDAHTAQVLQVIADAEEFKTKGNKFFQQSPPDYRKALANYHKVFLYIKTLKDPRDDLKDGTSLAGGGGGDFGVSMASSQMQSIPEDRVNSVRKLQASTYTNMATCYIALYHQSMAALKQVEELVEGCVDANEAEVKVSEAEAGHLLKALDITSESNAINRFVRKAITVAKDAVRIIK